jgi:hypothetical protein
VTVKCWIFGVYGVFGLTKMTMHPIDRKEKVRNIIINVAGSPALRPNDLQKECRGRTNKIVLEIKPLHKEGGQ